MGGISRATGTLSNLTDGTLTCLIIQAPYFTSGGGGNIPASPTLAPYPVAVSIPSTFSTMGFTTVLCTTYATLDSS